MNLEVIKIAVAKYASPFFMFLLVAGLMVFSSEAGAQTTGGSGDFDALQTAVSARWDANKAAIFGLAAIVVGVLMSLKIGKRLWS
jgi:hypothetical protein